MDVNNVAANLLVTRLCHDVTGPISAINQGVELLEEDDAEMRTEAMKLIADSAAQASARLQFYRSAYGHVPSGGEVPLRERQALIEDFLRPLRIKIEWQGDPQASLSHSEVRLVFNLLIIAAETMLRGGEITLEDASRAGRAHVRLRVRANTLKLPPELLEILSGGVSGEAQSPKDVQHVLTAELLKLASGRVEAQQTGDNQWEVVLTTGRP